VPGRSTSEHPRTSFGGDHARSSFANDRPRPSCPLSSSLVKKKGKLSHWLCEIFGTCSYAANTTYEAHLEIRELCELSSIPLLEATLPPPSYSDISSDDDDTNEI
jgi:hypothetical protein